MHDDELLDALRTGLDAVDPPPALLRDKAIEAANWPPASATEAVPRSTDELADAGMRSGEEPPGEPVRDHSFRAAGHDVEISIDVDADGREQIGVIIVIVPPVDEVTLVSPLAEAHVVALDRNGQAHFRSTATLAAVEFRSGSGETVRTPLIDFR